MAEETTKFMDGKEITDITPSSLVKEYFNNTSEIKDLELAINAWDAADRNTFLGDIDDDVATAFTQIIRFFNQQDAGIPVEERTPIKIYINSYGGSLTGALTIADAIVMSKTPVYTINIGCAYSGGMLVFIVGDKRYACPSASFLFHEGSTESNHMDAGKFRNFADYYEKLIGKMKDYFLKYTKMTEEFYKEKYRDDLWLFVEDAIELGVMDEVLEEYLQ